jgi:hypothetical protein
MQWEKLGLLWAPNGEIDWAQSHAALPVVQPLADKRWWVYLSIRNAEGKSHIGRITVDVTDRPEVERFEPSPILGLGAAGAFDDSGVMPSWLVDYQGQLRLYYTGWNVPNTVSYRLAIGLAVSDDGGNTYQRYSTGPIIDRSTKEPFFVCSPCVMHDGGLWRMWYPGCIKWVQIKGRWEPSYHIKYAESFDGVNWNITGVSCLDMHEDYAVARPCVYKRGATYCMLYPFRSLTDYRTVPEQAYRLGYAESADGVHWERMDDQVGIERSTSGWDSEMIEYSWLQRHGDQTYLLYNGNGFGRSGVGVARLVSLAARA